VSWCNTQSDSSNDWASPEKMDTRMSENRV
jgi:hypothetical protein